MTTPVRLAASPPWRPSSWRARSPSVAAVPRPSRPSRRQRHRPRPRPCRRSASRSSIRRSHRRGTATRWRSRRAPRSPRPSRPGRRMSCRRSGAARPLTRSSPATSDSSPRTSRSPPPRRPSSGSSRIASRVAEVGIRTAPPCRPSGRRSRSPARTLHQRGWHPGRLEHDRPRWEALRGRRRDADAGLGLHHGRQPGSRRLRCLPRDHPAAACRRCGSAATHVTFTSPLFGYSIKTTPTWPTHAATKPWTGVNNDTLDGIDVTQDEGLGASSQALGSRTFDEFVAAFHANQKATSQAAAMAGSRRRGPPSPSAIRSATSRCCASTTPTRWSRSADASISSNGATRWASSRSRRGRSAEGRHVHAADGSVAGPRRARDEEAGSPQRAGFGDPAMPGGAGTGDGSV